MNTINPTQSTFKAKKQNPALEAAIRQAQYIQKLREKKDEKPINPVFLEALKAEEEYLKTENYNNDPEEVMFSPMQKAAALEGYYSQAAILEEDTLLEEDLFYEKAEKCYRGMNIAELKDAYLFLEKDKSLVARVCREYIQERIESLKEVYDFS